MEIASQKFYIFQIFHETKSVFRILKCPFAICGSSHSDMGAFTRGGRLFEGQWRGNLYKGV